MEKQPLTIYQKLTKTFGFMGSKQTPPPSFEFDKEELLKTDSRTDFEKAKLQAQQTQYIADKWSKLDMSLYNQSVYYEPNRISAYYDYESMEFSIHSESMIYTLDGFQTIKSLADKGRDYEFITYAYDHNKKQVVPALARNAHYTRDEMTYKITFDDGKFIIATYGHRFLKRNGVYCKVEDLKVGDSMMPFYTKSFYPEQRYNWIYTCNSKVGNHGWVPEHTLVAEHLIGPLEENEVVHHIDFNGKNNLVKNLKIWDSKEHQSFHASHNNKKLWADPDYRKKMSEVAKKVDKYHWDGARSGKNNPAYFDLPIENIIDAARKYITFKNVVDELKISRPKIRRTINANGYVDWMDLLEKNNIEKTKEQRTCNIKNSNPGTRSFVYKHIPWDLLVDTALSSKTAQETAKKLNVTWHKIIDDIKRAGYNDWKTFINSYDANKSVKQEEDVLVNHKIWSIEPYGVVPVYDLTVPGYKNFATDTIFSHNTPEVSAALDIYSEESSTKSEKGQILTIHSDSKRIKHILDDLFYNVLDINTNIQMWTRGMCKYGDNFVYLKIDPEKGIVGCQQLPNIEVQRLEGARQSTPNQSDRVGSKFPSRELRFTWMNKDMEFQAWEIAHFRILGDDRKLPYGTSMLDKIRRIWKQLLLAEDAMLVYRTSRAPERRVFKVFVGNMDDKDIEPYVQKIANKFKRDQVVDQKNGQVDMRYNQMAVDQDYFIPVRDASQPSPIETLPGAQNLGEIADIEYIQKKMLAALRIPKAFLGFEDVIGNGKGLALLDIRFARTINRIQQSIIQELNKIALIQLFLLGLEDELNNFTLMLTNPSGQSDLLKIEQWKEKITMYKDATSDQSQMGILPVSHTWAKKNILGFSDNEVILDLQQQRMERAIGFELTNTQMIIKRTHIFDDVDKKYGISEDERKKLESAPPAQPGEAPGGGGGGGGGGSSSMPETASPLGTSSVPGATGNEPGAPAGAAPAGGEAPLSESRKNKILSMLNEDTEMENLFDMKKAQDNIYQIEKTITDILNE
jgi:hypothetical protein